VNIYILLFIGNFEKSFAPYFVLEKFKF